ncbi:MAG TPA: AraC family transcriptional regulator [Ohtaekwangia sp.]|nr:AraC family transcriptional regulator [Ohtaekwangia sp.]
MINTALDSINFYFLFAVFQGVLLAFFISFNQPFRRPNLFLGLIILNFSVSLLHLTLEQSIHAFNARYPIPMNFGLAYGPLAYLHVASILNPKDKFVVGKLLHFLPTLLIDGVLFSAFFVYVRSNMTWAYANIENIQASALIVSLLSLFQLGCYTIVVYRLTRSARGRLKEFSKIQNWFSLIVFSWLFLIAFLVVASTIGLILIEYVDEYSFLLYNSLGIIIGLLIYGLGYLYILKYLKAVGNYTDRRERFSPSEVDLEHKKQRLLEIMEMQKLYCDPSLTVTRLSGHLGWPVNEVSFVINEAFRVSFNDWINRYRVKAFTELLQDPTNTRYTLTGLSEEVGFSSKASFYRSFKKETGMTPGDYLKAQGLNKFQNAI